MFGGGGFCCAKDYFEARWGFVARGVILRLQNVTHGHRAISFPLGSLGQDVLS